MNPAALAKHKKRLLLTTTLLSTTFLLPYLTSSQAYAHTTIWPHDSEVRLWTIAKLGGGITMVIFLVLMAGACLITRQIYRLLHDRIHSRSLLAAGFSRMSGQQIKSLLLKHSDGFSARLFLRLVADFQASGKSAQAQRVIADFVKTERNQLGVFRNRLVFLAESAAILGLLGTAWTMLVFLLEGNFDKSRLVLGMGLALVTTFSGLFVSTILNVGSKTLVGSFNKRLTLITRKAYELLSRLDQDADATKVPTVPPDPGKGTWFYDRRRSRRMTTALNRSAIGTLQLKALSDASLDGFIGQSLLEPITIVVETQEGKKVTGVPIRFEVCEGGGILGNRSHIAWVKTGRKGIAKIKWTMGEQVGPQKLRVSILNDRQKQLEFVSFARPLISDWSDESHERNVA